MSNEAMKLVLQRVMARLCDLLDEDHFAEIEGIVTNAGVTPPAQQEPVKYKCTVIDNEHPDGVPLERWGRRPAQQEIDWKDQYEKQKRRADMWIAKYEADIGPLEKAGTVAAQKEPACRWNREDDDHMPGTWRSDCGVRWTFTDDGPVGNSMKYCCGCGAILKEKNT